MARKIHRHMLKTLFPTLFTSLFCKELAWYRGKRRLTEWGRPRAAKLIKPITSNLFTEVHARCIAGSRAGGVFPFPWLFLSSSPLLWQGNHIVHDGNRVANYFANFFRGIQLTNSLFACGNWVIPLFALYVRSLWNYWNTFPLPLTSQVMSIFSFFRTLSTLALPHPTPEGKHW